MNIHIIEDDPILARSLQINLELEGYRIFFSTNLKSAVTNQDKEQIDFVILDLGLPDGSGFDFLSQLRQKNASLPVIILSAQSDEDSVVKGLQLGANDFVKKPYSYKELHARMKSTIKKPLLQAKQFSYLDVIVNIDQRVIKHNDQTFELNRREFDIFSHLVQRAEMIVSRETLITVLNHDSDIFDRTIDSHISHIRKSLKKANINSIKISSVYGLGYRLEKNDA